VIAAAVCEELLPENLFENYNYEYMYETFGCETDRVLPIYFEHKIANEFGAYQFIKEITETPVSRRVIDKIKQEDVDSFVKSFNFVIVITHYK